MTHPSSFRSGLLRSCTRCVADTNATVEDRVLAARVAAQLLRAGEPTEQERAEAVSAVVGAMGVPAATDPILHALVRSAREPHRIVSVLGRVGNHAWLAHDFDTMGTVVLLMLAHAECAESVPEEWIESTLDVWLGRGPRIRARLRRLVIDVVGRGPVPAWFRQRVTTFPGSFFTLDLPPSVQRELHRAAPTVDGWRALARKRLADGWPIGWETAEFGETLPDAIETLREALGRQPEGRQSVVLASWLVALTSG